MYHARFYGNHYEIGFQWGARLAKHANYILNNIPFPITEERIGFAEECLPIYQEYFPEILDEIQGIADGQSCDVKLLQGLLFSIYAMPPACQCSCFAVSNENSIFFGRNSDFLTAIEKNNLNVIYRFPSDSFSFTGNTTAFVQMEDGVNEKGLAVGLTSVYPPSIRPGMNAGLLLRFFLEKCRSVDEVIFYLNKFPISSAQTFTVADASGNLAVLECYCDKVAVLRPIKKKPYVCATNRFHSDELSLVNTQGIDDWQAETRYQTLVNFLEAHTKEMTLEESKQLLRGEHGFLCQYDRSTGKDTVWSVLYDLKEHQIYRTEKNPSRTDYKLDKRFPF